MIDCLILGDSVSQGISNIRKECVAYVTPGVTSTAWNKQYLTRNLSAKTVIISLGNNDLNDSKTRDELFALRVAVKAERVYWIIPANRSTMREAVTLVAFEYNDIVLPLASASELAKITRN